MSCTELYRADSELPPCWLCLSVYFWGASVRHKTGNYALTVALSEGVQQRGSGLLIMPWTWRKKTEIGRVFHNNLYTSTSYMVKGIKYKNLGKKSSYPGSMSAGSGDSVGWPVCRLFDTWLLLRITGAFFPFLVSTGSSFLLWQST